jgi:hypothetical protein
MRTNGKPDPTAEAIRSGIGGPNMSRLLRTTKNETEKQLKDKAKKRVRNAAKKKVLGPCGATNAQQRVSAVGGGVSQRTLMTLFLHR